MAERLNELKIEINNKLKLLQINHDCLVNVKTSEKAFDFNLVQNEHVPRDSGSP